MRRPVGGQVGRFGRTADPTEPGSGPVHAAGRVARADHSARRVADVGRGQPVRSLQPRREAAALGQQDAVAGAAARRVAVEPAVGVVGVVFGVGRPRRDASGRTQHQQYGNRHEPHLAHLLPITTSVSSLCFWSGFCFSPFTGFLPSFTGRKQQLQVAFSLVHTIFAGLTSFTKNGRGLPK